MSDDILSWISCPTCDSKILNVEQSRKDKVESYILEVLGDTLKDLTIVDDSNPSYYWGGDGIQIIIRFPLQPISGDNWDRVFGAQHAIDVNFKDLYIRFYHISDSKIELNKE